MRNPRSGTGCPGRAHHTRSRDRSPARDRAAGLRHAPQCRAVWPPPDSKRRRRDGSGVPPRCGTCEGAETSFGPSWDHLVANLAAKRLVTGARAKRVRRYQHGGAAVVRLEPQDHQPTRDEGSCPEPRSTPPSVGEPDTERSADVDPCHRTPRVSQRVETKSMDEAPCGEDGEHARGFRRHRADPYREHAASVHSRDPRRDGVRRAKVESTCNLVHECVSVRLGELAATR